MEQPPFDALQALTKMSMTDLVQTLALVIAFIALIVSFFSSRKQLQLLNEQLQLQFFADYTKRYQEILLNLPEQLYLPGSSLDQLSDSDKSRALRYLRAYFDLCSEELYWWKKGKVDTATWENWKEGIESALCKKPFREAWQLIAFDTFYYADFCNWMNATVEKLEAKENALEQGRGGVNDFEVGAGSSLPKE